MNVQIISCFGYLTLSVLGLAWGKVWTLIPGSVEFGTVPLTAPLRCDVSSEFKALLPNRRYAIETTNEPPHSLLFGVKNREYNEN